MATTGLGAITRWVPALHRQLTGATLSTIIPLRGATEPVLLAGVLTHDQELSSDLRGLATTTPAYPLTVTLLHASPQGPWHTFGHATLHHPAPGIQPVDTALRFDAVRNPPVGRRLGPNTARALLRRGAPALTPAALGRGMRVPPSFCRRRLVLSPSTTMTVTAQSPTVQRFVDALHSLEAGGDTPPFAALVTSSAEVLSIDGHGPRHGPAGMTELFTQYLAQFEHVETTFTRITENNTRAALEWSSDAVLTGGHPVTYTGITILDHTDGQITRFRTTYDSGALLRLQATTQHVEDTTPAASEDDTAPTPRPVDHSGADHSGASQGGAEQGDNPVVGRYGADSGFLAEADRAAATGRDT